MNHCENATKIREAILLHENVVNPRRFTTFRLKSTSNPLRITVKTKTHSEYSQRDSVYGVWMGDAVIELGVGCVLAHLFVGPHLNFVDRFLQPKFID